MTNKQKALMGNPEHKPLMDLPKEIQKLMKDNGEHLLRLRGNGNWKPCKGYIFYGEGYIFKVDPEAPTQEEARRDRSYPVFCGSDGIYKVDLTPPNSTKTCNRYLVTVTGMRDFAGIRYQGCDAILHHLCIPQFGIPMEVFFRR